MLVKSPSGTCVSPGLMPRPSLSVLVGIVRPVPAEGVAGVDAPAFVERRLRTATASSISSLMVSPGLMPRPSLSGQLHGQPGSHLVRVAGVDAPAFVERSA